MQQTALIILDGWGYREDMLHNAVAQARTPNFDRYWNQFPHTLLAASGEAVGLPEGQVGNSEIGHMTIGAGRTLDTDLVRISKSIREKKFSATKALQDTFQHVKKYDSSLHILGLLGTGGVHAHQEHLHALLAACKENGVARVYLHVFTDGRDTAPQSAAEFMETLEHELQAIGVGKLATITGRYYAMDRDSNWDRIERAEQAIFQASAPTTTTSPTRTLRQQYAADIRDEHLEPIVVLDADGKSYPVSTNDGVFLFNFRADRARMITERLLARKAEMNLFIATMTEYNAAYDVAVAFPPETLATTLAQEISDAGLTQAHIAETEKFPHATYFLNGGKEQPHQGEEHVLLASRKDVATHDLAPKMRAEAIAEEAIQRIHEGVDFLFINFANPDMVGHTANVPAIIEAIEETDKQLGRVVDALLAKRGVAIITADHGNAEVNVDLETGVPHTAHTYNLVPCIVTQAGLTLRSNGTLTWLAPSCLRLLDIPQPTSMTGNILWENT